MKSKGIFLILLILVLQNVLAIEFQIKEQYNKGETSIVKVTGIIDSQILPENIYFYRAHVRVPVLYDVTKIGNDFYIYAILPES